MKLLITGATGFLGSHLARHFVQAGHSPILLKRSTSDTWRIDDIIEKVPSYNADEMDDYSLIFKEHDIDIIIFTATQYGRDNKNAHEIISSNLLLPAKILDSAIQYNVKCFINSDTFTRANYGNLRFYGLSKSQFREWLHLYRNNIKIINLVLHHVYGPYDNPSKFIPFVIKEIYQNKTHIDFTPGEQKRDFIYIKDVLTGYQKIIDSYDQFDGNYTLIELGTGKSHAIKELVLLVREISGNKMTQLNFGALPYSENEVMEEVSDCQSIESYLNWKPSISLREGLDETFRWYEKYFKETDR